MEENFYPIVVLAKGKSHLHRKLPFNRSVATSAQKKIDKIQRNNSISLRLKYGTVEKARDVMSLDFKKGQLAMKKRKKMYKRELVQYKQLQEVRDQSFLPANQKFNSDHHRVSLPPSVRERQEAKLRAYNLDFLNSVRRKQKPITNHRTVVKQLSDLHSLETKHRAEYMQAIGEIQRLQNQTRNYLRVKIPNRISESEVKPDETEEKPLLISRLRSRIREGEKQMDRIQNRFQRLATELYPEKATRELKEIGEEQEQGDGVDKEKMFRLFCENSFILKEWGTKRDNSIEGCLPSIRACKREGSAASEQETRSGSGTPLQLPALRPKYQHSISLNIAEDFGGQCRSRKLLEANKADKMHIWLGYKTKEEMTQATAKQMPRSYRQEKYKPATLEHILESPLPGEEDGRLTATEKDNGSIDIIL